MELLELPTEIRLKVLEQLLFRAEPLIPRPVPCRQCADAVPQVAVYTHLFEHKAQKKTLGLYTEVLRTCHQLHNEGTPILYANTAAIKAWLEDGAMAPWLRHEPGKYQKLSIGLAQYRLHDQAVALKGLPTRLSNVQLTIKLNFNDSDIANSYEPFYRNIATLLRTTSTLKRLDIYLIMPPSFPGSHERQRAHFGLIWDGLRRVRGIPHVQISGNVPQVFAAQLAASMMESECESGPAQ